MKTSIYRFYIGEECDSVDLEERTDCGWLGIDSTACLDRGCCYDPYHGSYYCFYPKGKCFVTSSTITKLVPNLM